ATVAKVSTAVSTILDPQEMLQAVVDQVKESFNLYHAHAYLLNETGDTLELVAGAGKVGQQMVQEGRPIPLTAEQSLVARAARSRTGVIVNNVRKDPHFLAHPLLPETRAEMAVPMIVGGQVLGVLDLQADTANRFTQRYVNIQTTLATQIAVALQNARLFAQAQQHTAELQETESELRATSERMQTVLEAMSTPVVIVAQDDARILYANEMMSQLMDVPLAEMPGTLVFDFYVHESDATNYLEQVMATGSMSNYEVEFKRRNGEHIWALLSTRLLNYEGKPALISTLIDISSRKQVEAQLRLQDTALNSAANGIAITDNKGTILWVNEAFSRLTQYDVQEAIGENPRILKSDQQDKRFYQNMWDTINSGQVWHGEIVNRRKDGSFYTEEMTITPVRAEGEEISHFIAIKQDVTERKEAQEALRRSEQIVQESLRMQQILHEVNLELSQTANLDELYRQSVYLGENRLNLDRFALYLYDETRELFAGTYGTDVNGNLRDERSQAFEIAIPDVAVYFRDGKQRIRVQENCDLWDDGAVVGQGWLVTVPVWRANKLAGVLFADNLISQEPFSPYLQDLLIAYSNIIANLIERKRAEESIAAALAESERLYEMSARLNAATSMHEILEAVIVPVAGRGLMAANLFTLEVDANGRPEWMEMVANWADATSVLANVDFPIGSRFYLPDLPTASQWIDAPNEILLYGDVDQDETIDAVTRGLYQMSGVKAGASLPLHVGSRWVGLIVLSWDETKTFSDDDRRTYYALADQTAIIMNNQLLFEQTQKRAAELATVAEVGAAITSVRDVDVLLQRVVDLAKERFSLYHAHIYLLDESGRNLILTSGAGEVGRQLVAEGRTISLDQAQSLI
ncbi:MAG TPA: PAS domain-containing protein, partial [Chloroflexota bacterium]|nr:PAS domain-containing protein [Chloroflexota bacterium]